MSTSFKVEMSDGPGSWGSNALRFATREEAESHGAEVFSRWMAAREYRVVESEDPVTDVWIDGRPVSLFCGWGGVERHRGCERLFYKQGEVPFKCEQCQTATGERVTATWKRDHGIDPFLCDACHQRYHECKPDPRVLTRV